MWIIKYCGSWNYRPQAESLSVEMNNAGLPCQYQEGEKGQFELFHGSTPYLKEGIDIPKVFTLADVEKKLAGG